MAIWDNLRGVTGDPIHAGSWSLFGRRLPDIGLTELVGRALAKEPHPLTGGSQLTGGELKTPVTPSQVKGVEPIGQQTGFVPRTTAEAIAGQRLPSPPADTRFQQLAKMDRNPIQEAEYQSFLEQAPAYVEPDIDISPQLAELTARAGQAEQEATEQQTLIGQFQEAGVGRKETELAGREAEFEAQRAREERRTGEAISEQRRGYAEMSKGLMARYGTGVSTGLGAQAIIGRDVLRSIAQSRQILTETIAGIEREAVRTRENIRSRIDEINLQAQAQKLEARNNLQRILSEITQEKGKLQMYKQQRIMESLQDYRTLISQINARNTSFIQDLYKWDLSNQQKASTAVASLNKQFQARLQKALSLEDFLTPQETAWAKQQYLPEMYAGTQTEGYQPAGAIPEEKEETEEDLLNQWRQPS